MEEGGGGLKDIRRMPVTQKSAHSLRRAKNLHVLSGITDGSTALTLVGVGGGGGGAISLKTI